MISQRSAGSCTRSNAFPEDDYVRLCLNTDSLTSNDFLTKHVKNRMIFFFKLGKELIRNQNLFHQCILFCTFMFAISMGYHFFVQILHCKYLIHGAFSSHELLWNRFSSFSLSQKVFYKLGTLLFSLMNNFDLTSQRMYLFFMGFLSFKFVGILQRCRWVFKSGWASSNVVGIICPPGCTGCIILKWTKLIKWLWGVEESIILLNYRA